MYTHESNHKIFGLLSASVNDSRFNYGLLDVVRLHSLVI